MNYIDAAEFLSLSKNLQVVDVRSPGEYLHGHITKASNIPLFDDKERAQVGIIYNLSGRAMAEKKGYEIAEPKKLSMIEEAFKIAKNNKLLVHCWRGGMRSEKMAELFEANGIPCHVLKGGYKAYRKKLFNDFEKVNNLVVIYGPTGSGKTKILNALSRLGEQVIDLEFLAKHRGSAFGDIGLNSQPTTMQFQNDIHYQLMKFERSRPVWIEGESLNIGKVYLPFTLWEKMNHSTILKIDMEKKFRIKRIAEEYGKYDKSKLIGSVKKIMRRFGGDRALKVINYIEKNQLEEAVEMLLDYYDKNYNFSLEKYMLGEVIPVKTGFPDPMVNAQLLLKTLQRTVRHV